MTFRPAECAKQLLPRDSYVDEARLQAEQETLFAMSWAFAGLASELKDVGDYRTVQVGRFSLVVVRGRDGALHGFHNICRHRGTELLDQGCGNAGKTIVCPYHRWTYGLDGALRGVPDQRVCFPDLDKARNGLHPASVGVFQGLIFACPEPGQRVEDWLGSIADVAWPHDPDDPGLSEFPDSVVYDMACNWKVFYENAIDGYHLAYLHEHTLGGPLPSQNLWERHGDHLVWYSTENSGHRSRVPNHLNEQAEAWGSRKIPAAATHGYGGVYMLFPATLVVATPWSLSISVLEPVAAGRTLMHVRSWQPKSLFGSEGRAKDIPGYDAATGRITSSNWTQHPLETGDFQTEDVYVVEKMQRALQSPRHSVGALAQGAGAELPITWFQSTVLRHMGKAATE